MTIKATSRSGRSRQIGLAGAVKSGSIREQLAKLNSPSVSSKRSTTASLGKRFRGKKISTKTLRNSSIEDGAESVKSIGSSIQTSVHGNLERLKNNQMTPDSAVIASSNSNKTRSINK